MRQIMRDDDRPFACVYEYANLFNYLKMNEPPLPAQIGGLHGSLTPKAYTRVQIEASHWSFTLGPHIGDSHQTFASKSGI